MLDRDEAAALAEIEASLRRDDPEFVSMLERLGDDPRGTGELAVGDLEHQLVAALDAGYALAAFEAQPQPTVRRWLRVVATVFAVVLAVTLTLAVTALWGPDVGGLTGVVAVMAATMFGYQALRGCPGRR